MREYPASIDELDLDSVKFPPAVLEAVKAFSQSRPWRGSIEERKDKFLRLNNALAAAYSLPSPRLIFAIDECVDSGSSVYISDLDTIIIRGRLSSITFLHEWGHKLLGPSEFKACEFSLALFRKCFPKSWGRLSFNGHMAVGPKLRRSRPMPNESEAWNTS